MPFKKTKKMEPPLVSQSKTDDEEEVKSKITAPDAKEVIATVAKQQRGAEEKAVETKQVITFELDKEEYAAPILDLREILRIPEIIAVPGTPPFVRGIFNLRGQIVLVIDLEKRFALKREHEMKSRDVIIVDVGGTVFGVMVDEVTGVLRIPITSIKPTPSLIASKIKADYLNGVIVLEGSQDAEQNKKKARTLLLLDLPRMLSEEELLDFGATVRQTVETSNVKKEEINQSIKS